MVAFMKKTLALYPFIPFLFLVSSPSLESVLDTMKAGAVDYLRKPVTREALSGSVSRSMDRMEASLEAEKLRKEIQKKLAKTRKEAQNAKTLSSFKGFMISMAAHDFRTILTVLDGYLQFLREKCRECPVSGDEGLLRRASRTVERLLSMTNTLLDHEAAETAAYAWKSSRSPWKKHCGSAWFSMVPTRNRNGCGSSWNRCHPESRSRATAKK
jgi:signal transduction histidine kinase